MRQPPTTRTRRPSRSPTRPTHGRSNAAETANDADDDADLGAAAAELVLDVAGQHRGEHAEAEK